MFNISLTDLTERREERLEWHSEPEDVNLCIMKGLDEVNHETLTPPDRGTMNGLKKATRKHDIHSLPYLLHIFEDTHAQSKSAEPYYNIHT